MRTWLTVLLALCVVSCNSIESPENTSDFALVHFGVDDESLKNVRQLVFEFNRPITILGAIPGQQQLSAIRFDHPEPPQCRWRFLDTQRLACELTVSLPAGKIYPIHVEAFPALDGSQSASWQQTITTPYPEWPVGGNYHWDHPFQNVQLSMTFDNEQDKRAFAKAVVARAPSGKLLKVTMMQSDRKNANRFHFVLKDIKPPLADGDWQLILRSGFRLPNADYALTESQVLYDTIHYKEPRSLGFYCGKDNLFEPVTIGDDQLVRCPPQSIYLGLSHPLNPSYQTRLPGLKGDHKLGMHYQSGKGIFKGLNLMGGAAYRWTPHVLHDHDGRPFEGLEPLEFNTPDFKPGMKQYLDYVLSVPSRPYQPKVTSVNEAGVKGKHHVINTRMQLQEWLNNTSEAQDKFWSFKKDANQLVHTSLGYDQLLDDEYGLVMSHLDMAPGIQSPGAHEFNKSAFNIAHWLGDDLLIYLSDWHDGKPMSDVDVWQVCSDQPQPKHLGKSNAQGSVLVSADKLPADSCWLWAEKPGRVGCGKAGYCQNIALHVVYRPSLDGPADISTRRYARYRFCRDNKERQWGRSCSRYQWL